MSYSFPNQNFFIENDGKFNNLNSVNSNILPLTLVSNPIVKPAGAIAYDPANQNIIYSNGLIWKTISGGSSDGPLPFLTQIVYVENGGNDSTGDGTIIKPYATISYALGTITDSAYEKRYLIIVGPGIWTENIHTKAWVYFTAGTNGSTRFTGTVDINDPSWAIPGSHSDERGGFQNITFTGLVDIDFTIPQSLYGKMYFWNCNFNQRLSMIGYHPVNQISAFGGQWFNGIANSGVNFTISSIELFSGDIMLTSNTAAATIFGGFNGASQGNLVITYTTGPGIDAELYDFYVNGINAIGSSVTISATSSSLPLNINISIAGGASLTYLSDAFGLGYSPSIPSHWTSPAPVNVMSALDRISSLLFTLNGNTPIP